MKHPLKVEKYNGSLDELARDISTLRYDKLAELFKLISDCVEEDSHADFDRGYKQLSDRLYKIHLKLIEARFEAEDAWNICKPYMNPNEIE